MKKIDPRLLLAVGVAGLAMAAWLLLMGAVATHATLPWLNPQLPYDPLRDFDGVAVLGTSPLVLAVPAGQGIASLADLQKPSMEFGQKLFDGLQDR